jgi:hypothetical protein
MRLVLILIKSLFLTIKRTFVPIVIIGIIVVPVYKYTYKEDKVLCKLYNIYRDSGMLYPEIVLTQDYLETGGFNSRIAKENFNTRGMKHNARGFSLGEKNGHAYYANVYMGIADAVAWQKAMLLSYRKKYHNDIMLSRNEEDYLHFLGHLVINGKDYRYAEDTLYEKKIKQLLPLITEEIKTCNCEKAK